MESCSKKFSKIFAGILPYLSEQSFFATIAQKMIFIKDFFSKCDNRPQEAADLVTLTEEILNGKLDFLSSRHFSPPFSNSQKCYFITTHKIEAKY